MTDIKCPFCQQELVYDSGIEQWCCDKCHLSGGYKLWQELIRTRKALDVAVDALGVISQITNQIDVCDTANDALNTITSLKKKNK